MSSSEDLCNVIGEEAFDRVCVAFGGMRFFFGPAMRERLSLIIGDALAREAVHQFSGEFVEIPMESKRHRENKAVELQKRLISQQKSGLSVQEIAVSNQMTPRQVRNILNSPER